MTIVAVPAAGVIGKDSEKGGASRRVAATAHENALLCGARRSRSRACDTIDKPPSLHGDRIPDLRVPRLQLTKRFRVRKVHSCIKEMGLSHPPVFAAEAA